MGIFAGIKDKRPTMDASYINPGAYWAKIDGCKIDKNRKGDVFAAVEMTVVSVLDDPTGKANRKGESVSHLFMQKSDYFLGDIKAFVAKVFDMDPADITEENCVAIFPESGKALSPLIGTIVEVHAKPITTKENKPFTKISYRREVKPQEVLEAMDPSDLARYFPGNVLQNAIKKMDELAAAQA